MALPTNRTRDSTITQHTNDHNTLHGFRNDHPGDALAHDGTYETVGTTAAGITDHQADPAAHSGTYVPTEILGGTVVQTVLQPPQVTIVAWGIANNGLYLRCVSRGTVNAVRLRVGTQSGDISVAAYRADGTNGLPGTRLASSGVVACPTAGDANVALGSSVTMEVGDWLFLSCDNTTATFFSLSSTGGVADTSLAVGICYRAGNAHPAPSPAGGSSPGITASIFRPPWLVGVTV